MLVKAFAIFLTMVFLIACISDLIIHQDLTKTRATLFVMRLLPISIYMAENGLQQDYVNTVYLRRRLLICKLANSAMPTRSKAILLSSYREISPTLMVSHTKSRELIYMMEEVVGKRRNG